MHRLTLTILASLIPTFLAAQEIVINRSDFVAAVGSNTLEIPLLRVQLHVLDDGQITGTALGLKVTGEWDWKEGFFCRRMNWGERNLEYNCQQVTLDGKTLIFTSDKGTGRSAKFSLRPMTKLGQIIRADRTVAD